MTPYQALVWMAENKVILTKKRIWFTLACGDIFIRFKVVTKNEYVDHLTHSLDSLRRKVEYLRGNNA